MFWGNFVVKGKAEYSFNVTSTVPGTLNNMLKTIGDLENALKVAEEKTKNLNSILQTLPSDKELNEKITRAKDEYTETKAKRDKLQAEITGTNTAVQNADDDVQYEARYVDKKDKKKYKKHSYPNDYETNFMRWANGSAPVGETKKFVRFGKHHFYEKTIDGCIELTPEQFYEKDGATYEKSYSKANRRFNVSLNDNESSKTGDIGNRSGDRNTGRTLSVPYKTFGERLRGDAGRSLSDVGGDDTGASVDTQAQPRTTTLSDIEILEAAQELVSDTEYTPAEKNALEIFKKRLDKLHELQERRAEAGRRYNEVL